MSRVCRPSRRNAECDPNLSGCTCVCHAGRRSGKTAAEGKARGHAEQACIPCLDLERCGDDPDWRGVVLRAKPSVSEAQSNEPFAAATRESDLWTRGRVRRFEGEGISSAQLSETRRKAAFPLRGSSRPRRLRSLPVLSRQESQWQEELAGSTSGRRALRKRFTLQ